MRASALGQVIALLARHSRLPWRIVRRCDYAIEDGYIYRVGSNYEVVIDGHCQPEGAYYYASEIPQDLVMIAAADHCLGSAYRGECPGVDPETLLAWRVADRARFQRRSEGELRADIERARALLRSAPLVEVGLHHHTRDHDWSRSVCDGCAVDLPTVRDMRGPTPVPELVEASMMEAAEYMSGPLLDPKDPGREKFTVSARPETVKMWLEYYAPTVLGLEDLYGDPSRGFGGGYRQTQSDR